MMWPNMNTLFSTKVGTVLLYHLIVYAFVSGLRGVGLSWEEHYVRDSSGPDAQRIKFRLPEQRNNTMKMATIANAARALP